MNGTAPGTAGTGGGAKGTGGNGAGSGNNKGANGAAGTAISGGAAGGTPGGTGGNGCSGGCRAQTGGVGTPGTNGTGFTAGDRPTATLVNAAYFTPSGKSSDGQAGGGGAGGGGGGGSASYGVFGACGGQPGGKGGDGGNGGAGGFGGYGAGGTFGIWRYNSNSSVNITNVIVSTGTAGTGGTGAAGTSGAAGSAGAGGGSNGGVCSSSNGGGTGGAGGKGGDGGRGRDGANGLAAKMVVDGTPSDPSTVIPNPTTVNINYTRTNIPGKACTNSEIDLSKVAGTWSFPSGLSLVNDVTPTTQSYDPSSNNIKVTTVSTGKYDLLVNGEVYANYLKVNTTRNLPVFNSATISICKGGTASFGVNSSFEPSNIAEREWLVYTTSPSSPLFSSSSAGLTTGILNTVGTYIVRYRERHNCCGWSIPVFGQIVVNELPFANNITPIPNQPVICEGVNISADFAGASGGGGTITDEFEISTDGGNNWNNYTVNAGVGSSVSTSGLGGKTVIIRTRRTATGSGCGSTDYNTYSWAIDKFTIANAGTDQLVCGTTATLTANLPAVGAGSWSLQSGSGSIDYSTEAVTTISGLGVGSNVFRWTLDNGFICGDSYDEVTITRDNIAPLLTCKSAILSLDATGNTILSVADVENTASDNCGISTKTLSATNFTCLNVGTNTVTLTETDINGNSSTCTSTVSVLDEIAPVALCQDLIVDLDASPGGMATITGAQINNGSSDVCGISAYTVSPSTFTCANVGTNTVTLTVKDVNNNTSTCTATVTVQDVTIPNVSPVAECLPNVTVSIGKATLTINSGNLDNGSFDNCGFASLTVSPNTFTCSDIGSPITVTLTGTDAAGNSSTCTSQVSIVDEEAPDANCKSITVQLDNTGNAVISASDVNNNSTDNCGIASLGININSFNCADIGDKLITLTVTDNYSNASTCNARVTVEDNVSPLAICQNITVQLDNTGNGTTTAVAVDNGSTDACGIQTLSLNKYLFNCAETGANTVILTVTDNNNNTSTCTATVSVQDNIAPVITCNGNVNLNNDNGICGASINFSNSSSDNCSGEIITQTAGLVSGSVFPVGTTINSFLVTDASGNTASCSFSVTVLDNENPAISCPSDITVNSDAGICAASVSYVAPLGTDNCTSTTIQTSGLASGSNFAVGTTTNTFKVTDASGNTATCSFNITVEDHEAPSIVVCPIDIIRPTSPGVCYANVTVGTLSATDNCGALTIVNSKTGTSNASDQYSKGGTLVDWTVTDSHGNTSACQTFVYVFDQELPNAVCKDITVHLNSSGFKSITASNIENGSTDNCVIISKSLDNNVFDCSNVGANTITLSVIDNSGNIGRCTSTVTVVDDITPVALCQNVTAFLDASGSVNVPAIQVNNGSSDACGIASLVLNNSSFSCANLGAANPVTLTVTDNNNNTSTCNATVTVLDNIAPVAVCNNFTAALDANGQVTVTGLDFSGASSDNCSIVSRLVNASNFTCSNLGNNAVTVILTDQSGNNSFCLPTLTVIDNTPPAITCPANIVKNTDAGQCGALATFTSTATDNCTVSSVLQTAGIISGSQFPVGTSTVEFTATDQSGNTSVCSFTVSVTDTEVPVAICQDLTVQLDNNGNGSTTAAAVDNGSSDACGIASLVLSQTAFVCSEVGANTEVLTVTDVNGNTSTCTTTITVEDNVAPVAVCQNLTVQLDNTGQGSTTAAAVNNGSSDACGVADILLNKTVFNCSEVGSNIVTLTVTDVNGNESTCSATITVQDNIVPVAVCQDVTIQLNNSGNASTTATAVDNGSSDACGIQSLSLSQTTFVCSEVGANTEVLTVTDVNGNTSTCTATISVEDNVAPAAVCQNVTVQLDNTGNGSTTAIAVDNGSSDACGIASLVLSQTSFLCSEVGANTEVLTVTDVNGNTSTCTATITVVDGVAPVAVCQNVTVQLDNTGNGSTTAVLVNYGSSDACGIASLVLSQTAFVCSEVGNKNVVLTVTDVNGNVSQCNAIVTVKDLIAPIALCQPVTVDLNAAGTASIAAAQVNNGSSDACGIASTTLNNSNFSCSNVGSGNTVVLTVTDVNGNSSTCSAVITVRDVTPPTAVCQNLTVNLNAAGLASITVAQVNNGSSDACGVATIAINNNSFTCANVGLNTVILTVTDVNGNSSTCSSTVTVNDITPPTAVCQAVTVNLDATGNGSITAAQVNNGSSDACGTPSLSVTPNTFNCTNVSSTVSTTPNATDLFISEYIEGSGNNKYLEIYNGTGAAVNLGDYRLRLYANGASIPGNDVLLSGLLANGATIVYRNASASPAIGTSNAALSFNGNDAIALFKISTNSNVDVFGRIGNDPGTAWTTGANTTVDKTLRRKATILSGVTTNPSGTGAGAFTTLLSEWDQFAIDVTSGLNAHTFAPASVITTVPALNPVILTVTDVNGNTSTCTANVTVKDLVAPTAVCQNLTVDLSAATSAGAVSIIAAQVNNGSTDACGVATTTINISNFTCANVGANTVVLTVTDVNGNNSTCSSTVTVRDITAPTAICKAVTVDLSAAGTSSITTTQVNNVSTDNCTIAGYSLNNSSFTCANVGANTVILTVTDVNGNSSTCSANITVRDVTAPTAICQPVTVNLSAAGTGSITAAQVNNGSSDVCTAVTLSVSPINYTCSNVGANTAILTVTDLNGNSKTCTATITVRDLVAPVAICKDVTVTLNAAGTGSTTASSVNNGSNDACGLATTNSLVLNNSSFTCANVGSANTVILTVTDKNANTSTCSAIVTVVDNTAPVANCQNLTVQLNASGSGSITGAQINNGSTDACGVASLSVSPNTFDCSNVNPVVPVSTDLFISEYVEGSSNNKYIEIYNGTGASVNLSNYQIRFYANGATSPSNTDVLSGTLANGGTIVYRNTSASTYSGTTTVLPTVQFNGNDAMVLWKVSTNAAVDIFGRIGGDPGSAWTSGGNTTIDKTLRRKSTITNGVSVNPALASPASASFITLGTEWDQFSVDDVSGLGIHSIGTSNPVLLTVTDVNGNSSTCTANVTVRDQVAPVAICQPVTVDLNAAGTGSISAAQVNNGSSDACGIATTTLNNSNFTCANVGANTVILTVTDVNGNSSTCSSAVTVRDLVAPVAICQPITVDLNAAGTGSITANQVNNGSSDACGIASKSIDNSSFNCSNVAVTNTVVLTVTDVNGNSSTCAANVTVRDLVAPVAICQNVTVQLDNTGNGSTTATAVDNGSSDACGVASLSLSQYNFACSEVGPNTEVLTVTDVNGNTSTCITTVTVEDNVAPVAICQDVTVQLDATGHISTAATAINNGSSDACGIANLALDQTAFICDNVGANTVVLTVTDVNGNTATCSATVTVEDNVAPVAICQNVMVQLDASGYGNTTAVAVDNGSTDACGLLPQCPPHGPMVVCLSGLSLSQTNFTCDNVGQNTVVLTVTDNHYNSSTCTAIVTVVDNVAPEALCQNVTVQLDATGHATTTATAVDNGSNDACGIAGLALSQTSFICSEVGSNTVTLTVTDVNNNSSTCTATVTVEDNVAPVAVCQNVTVQLDNTGNGSTTATAVDNGSSDACGVASLALSQTAFVCSEVGANTEVLTVTDVNGNTSTCTTTIIVEDNVAPVAVCQNVTVQLDNTGNGSTTAAAVDNGSSDACGVSSLALSQTAFVCTEVGANTEVLTVTDVNGNTSTCTTTITVEDNVAPVAVCQNVTVQLDNTGNGSTTAMAVDKGSSDACGIASLVLSQTAFVCSEVGANTEVLTVTDVNGNTSTCTTTITVEDNVAPVAVCQNVTVQLDNTGNGSTTAMAVDNGSSDACGIASLVLSQTAFVCSEVGANTEVLTVTDINGNTSTCTTTITVEDNVAPVAVCQNVTVQLDNTGNGSTTATAVDNGSSDACGIASLALSQTAFVCSEVGANTEVLTVIDVNGNTSTCTTTITVVDNVAPVAVCQNVTVQLDNTGNGSTTATAVDNGSSDACGIASLVLSQTAFVCSEVGANTEVLTVTDVNGNTSTCTTTITVQDNIAPVAVCQPVTVNLNAAGTGSITSVQVNNGSSDACGIASLTLNNSNFTCSNVGSGNTVVLTVTDVNGNTKTCSSVITVKDLVAPVAVCQPVTVNLNAAGTGSITPAQVNNGSSDACGIASLTLNNSNFTCSNVGSGNTVVLTVTDVNGNSSTCSSVITVKDLVAPVALCQNVTVLLDATGNGSTTATAVNNGSSDACGIASKVLSKTLFTCADVGVNTVTLTVTDINANVSTCSATVTVKDLVAPAALCKNITVQLNTAGTIAITASQVNNGSSDACGIKTITISPSTFTCANIGANTVVLTVTDNNNNVSTCSSTVTVQDLVAPVALCKNISVALNATGSVSITAAQVNNGSTDACGIQSTTVSPSVFNCTNTGTNTVTLTVKDVNGNISTCTSVVTVTGGPLYNYVILASKEAELENRSYVYSGGVGVTTSSGRADIEQYSTVTAAGTFVQSTHTYVSSGSSVTTQINSVAVAPIPTFETNPFNSNNNITVGNGQTVTLTDSIYNMIKIGKYGTVVFTQPVVNIRHIESQEYAAIRFTQCTKLRVKEHLHLKKNSLFNPDGLAVTVFAQKHVHVMDGCKVTGTVYAKDEDIKVWGKSNNRSVMTGLFIGEEVESEGYTDWYANTQCGRCSLGSGLFARISNSVDVSCSGATNGSATVAVTGGTAPYTYQWNNSTLQTTPTATGLGVGNYTVTVTDATGATTTATENITVFNYTILATDRIYIDRNDTVFGGSVGITSTSGRIDMDRYSGVIDDNSIVIAPYQTLDATNYINEQVFGIAPATTIPYQGNITYSSSSDLSVANNATVTLTATDTLRRNITIGDNATLIITGGKLNVTGNMTLNRNSKVRFTSCTNVRIKGNFYSNDNPNINPDGAGVTFFINGSSVNIDNSAKVNATIYAPNATIGISNGTASAPNIITGKLIGKTVDVGDYTYLYADDDCPCVPGTGAVTPDIIKPIISCPPNKTINVNATSDGNHHGWYYHNHDNGWHYGWYFHHHGWYYDNNDHSWHNGWYDDDDDCESASSVSLGVPVTSDNVGVATVTNNHPSSVYPVGTTVVIWTVTDFAGNSATCSQTVTVNCIGGHHLTNPTTVSPSASSVTAPTQTPAPAAVQSAERVVNVTSNAYPNPFKTNATIAFTVSESTDNVTLKVYNLEGTEIKQLYDGPAEGNVEYKFQLDADKSMDAGIYFYRVETKEGKAAVNKLILLK